MIVCELFLWSFGLVPGPLSLRRLSKGIVMHIFVDYLLPFFALISAMVIIHEMGHYLAARMIGLHVTHFSVGMVPPLLSRADPRGCLWQIRAFPTGGYFASDVDTGGRGTKGG